MQSTLAQPGDSKVRSLVLFLLLAWALPADSRGVVEEVPDELSFARNSAFSVFAVTIVRAETQLRTDGDSPDGVLRVDQVLRGRDVTPGEYDYRLPARPRRDINEQDQRERTAPPPTDGPADGDHLVVFSYLGTQPLQDDSLIVLQGPLIRDTPENRALVEDQLVHESRLLAPLFFLVLLVVAVALASLLLSMRASSPHRTHRLPVILPPIAVILYLIYESLVSPYANIRIDLLVLWPALAVAIIVCGVGLARSRSRA